MHGQASRAQARIAGGLQHEHRIGDRTPELPAQAPQCPIAACSQAAEDACARRVCGDRQHVLHAVGGEIAHAQGECVGDVPVGLGGVAVVDPLDRHGRADRLSDLLRAGRVDSGAPRGESGDHGVDGARLHREPHGGAGQLPQHGVVAFFDSGEVEDDPILVARSQGRAQVRIDRHGGGGGSEVPPRGRWAGWWAWWQRSRARVPARPR